MTYIRRMIQEIFRLIDYISEMGTKVGSIPAISGSSSFAQIVKSRDFNRRFNIMFDTEYKNHHYRMGNFNVQTSIEHREMAKTVLLKQIKELSELEKILMNIPKELW